MKCKKIITLITLVLSTLPINLPAHSQTMTAGHYTVKVEAEYDDAILYLKDAIINRGLKIDHEGHIGDMLARTEGAVGITSPFIKAHYLQFCSAKLSHAAMAADPKNLAVCPYVVFSFQTKENPKWVTLGYRRPMQALSPASEKPIKEIEDLMKAIIDEAAE